MHAQTRSFRVLRGPSLLRHGIPQRPHVRRATAAWQGGLRNDRLPYRARCASRFRCRVMWSASRLQPAPLHFHRPKKPWRLLFHDFCDFVVRCPAERMERCSWHFPRRTRHFLASRKEKRCSWHFLRRTRHFLGQFFLRRCLCTAGRRCFHR